MVNAGTPLDDELPLRRKGPRRPTEELQEGPWMSWGEWQAADHPGRTQQPPTFNSPLIWVADAQGGNFRPLDTRGEMANQQRLLLKGYLKPSQFHPCGEHRHHLQHLNHSFPFSIEAIATSLSRDAYSKIRRPGPQILRGPRN